MSRLRGWSQTLESKAEQDSSGGCASEQGQKGESEERVEYRHEKILEQGLRLRF